MKITFETENSAEALALLTALARPAAPASTGDDAPAKPTRKKTSRKKAAKKAPPASEPDANDLLGDGTAPPEEAPAMPTTDELKVAGRAFVQKHNTEALVALFGEFGGKKLADIDESDYPALMEKLKG